MCALYELKAPVLTCIGLVHARAARSCTNIQGLSGSGPLIAGGEGISCMHSYGVETNYSKRFNMLDYIILDFSNSASHPASCLLIFSRATGKALLV